MGLVEGIGSKARHLAENVLSHLFGHVVLHRSRNEDIPLLFHNIVLFLCHGTAHKVGSAIGIARHFAANLHYLLLINYAAAGNVQDIL